MEGIDWFGKYFQVKLEHNDKRRLYTIVNCLNQDNIKFRQQLLGNFISIYHFKQINEYFKHVQNIFINFPEFVSTNFKNGKVDKMPEYSDNLKLCIKKYKPEEKTLSSLIFQSLNKQLYVKGPLGQGLQIGNIGQGKIAIIVAGTGVLPFLDLLNFMLQKVIYEVAKKEIGKQFADQQIDIHNIGLDKFFCLVCE
ncbi:hypothetical protein PPERSA_01054 [Pseudocohnilembus persalinus]|uniref:Uncharacterized protein n=1 Tax=Pseudocohnilembus persalinus TaxID=266149 RepID=A0A0V0QVL0_PSEPJ|nr:hypothetical protein PPERSA_01054 [Pseudocohnilembus persalinus]|eukprot:KRX05976.1 hypothetical protein PPERSA_01054 [Pseudocohnilembus persalinus]